uniref:C-type lectin domain-containing protein n=1 Tax=Acanthochromis polyacanthus TaxID=80966 RepID=A0A3Q1F8R0_9TELE
MFLDSGQVKASNLEGRSSFLTYFSSPLFRPKHIFIRRKLNWNEAQAYCRQHYTELSFFNSQSDIDKLQNDTGGSINHGWIGLQRDPNNNTAWMWSGGGYITYENWHSGQPSNSRENKGNIRPDGKWNDRIGTNLLHFYCIDVTVEEKMSWEDALSHCREKQTDLANQLSEAELHLAKVKVKNITQRFWIGLRYLADRWLWVNGEPLEHESWSQGGDQDHHCPIQKRCGAIHKEGLWENWDCQDKLHFMCI